MRRRSRSAISGDRADHNAAPHEVADGIADILVIPAEPVDPAYNERLSRAEFVEQSAAFWTLGDPWDQ
jgi:hypothetical protein